MKAQCQGMPCERRAELVPESEGAASRRYRDLAAQLQQQQEIQRMGAMLQRLAALMETMLARLLTPAQPHLTT